MNLFFEIVRGYAFVSFLVFIWVISVHVIYHKRIKDNGYLTIYVPGDRMLTISATVWTLFDCFILGHQLIQVSAAITMVRTPKSEIERRRNER